MSESMFSHIAAQINKEMNNHKSKTVRQTHRQRECSLERSPLNCLQENSAPHAMNIKPHDEKYDEL